MEQTTAPDPEYKKVGRARKMRGLRFWSIDADGKVEEVTIAHGHRRLNMEKGKRYCQALNLKNAQRKFKTR